MNIGLLIVLVVLVVPLTVIVSWEWFSLHSLLGNNMDDSVLVDAVDALKDDLIQPPMMDNVIAFNDIILVDKSCQQVETALGWEKNLTAQELGECIDRLPNNFIHYSKNQWVNRHWVQKIGSDGLELFSGRKVSYPKRK